MYGDDNEFFNKFAEPMGNYYFFSGKSCLPFWNGTMYDENILDLWDN